MPNRTGDDGGTQPDGSSQGGLPAASASGDNSGEATGTASGSMDQGRSVPRSG